MKIKLVYIIPLVVLGIIGGVLIHPLISSDNAYDQLEKFKNIFGTTIKNYVDEVDTQKLTEAAIKGMLNDLDPHSVYISAEEMKSVNEDFQGSFDGIGVQFDMINDTITIITPISNGPSEKVGVQAGDKIIKIDDENAIGINRDEVPKKLKGPKGTTVKIDVKRGSSNELLSFSIVRDKIPLYSVDASFMFDGTDIGYIKVNRFAENTFSELTSSLTKLSSQGMKKLILDLRGNPGGFLQQAYFMASEFLSKGDTIVYTKGRRPEFNEYLINNKEGRFKKFPLIVLINQGSASASEIVSGAIQDLDRGLIVGTTSFGKGLVQRQFPNNDGSAFRLTISRYYTPSGRSIQRPYKDKSDYRHLVGRLELEEGSNIEHALENVTKKINKENEAKLAKDKKSKDLVKLDSLPIYKTRKGRTVLGGGGIIPDYIIKSDTMTKFTASLLAKRIFNEFNDNYFGNGEKIKNQYKNNFNEFKKDFVVSDKMIESFKKLVESKKIEWNEEQFNTDKDYITNEIKSSLAVMIWGSEKRYELFLSTIDRQVLKCLELFPEAEKIVKK